MPRAWLQVRYLLQYNWAVSLVSRTIQRKTNLLEPPGFGGVPVDPGRLVGRVTPGGNEPVKLE